MREAGHLMDGLALHYYTRMFSSGDNHTERRGSATVFEEDDWALILRKAHDTEEIVSTHSAIMDRYDPERRVSLVIDEWGTWFEHEPGTNPGFLYQQNTIRDAVSASISLNIFNNHAERVRMTNIAQTVNVLQAMVLTEGPQLILTPTYHVFDMYKGHQDATLLPTKVDAEQYVYDMYEMDKVSASASMADDGSILITLNNCDPNSSAKVDLVVRGLTPNNVSARVLTASRMQDHNTFENPQQVAPVPFDKIKIDGDALQFDAPPNSVVAVTVKQN